jgi:hypothetical protein
MEAVGDEDPNGHEYPAVHDPVQVATVSPVVDPYKPAAQLVQLAALPVL